MPVPRSPRAFSIVPLLAAFLTACGGSDGPTTPGGGGGATPTGVVSGTVVDGAQGVSGAALRLTRSGSTLNATTNASGAFSFPSVPTGSWTLALTTPDAFELRSGSASRTVNVTDGGTAQETFQLERFEGTTITVVDNAFQPASATVAAGGQVRWRATTSTGHTVTPEGHSAWASQAFASAGTVLRVTLATAGTYDYFCEPHRSEGMVGEVTVN